MQPRDANAATRFSTVAEQPIAAMKRRPSISPPERTDKIQPSAENPHGPSSSQASPPIPPSGQAESTREDYDAALSSLYNRINYEKIGHAPYTANHYRLDRMRHLLTRLGAPQNNYAIVHVAGTKGKGTTSTLIHDCLCHCGFRTGLYTSPHLTRLEERFQVDGEPCTPGELVSLTREVIEAAQQIASDGHGEATFFELTTAIGMLFFAQRGVSCVVLEVGLGGRLDSTNVCEPLVSVITAISMDHQAQLGNTIEEIAGEKAGIIKRGTPVVSVARHPDAQKVIIRKAAELDAPLEQLDRDFQLSWEPIPWPAEREHQPMAQVLPGDAQTQPAFARISLRRMQTLAEPATNTPERSWKLRLLGQHQADNVAAAVMTLDCLRRQGWEIPEEKVEEAISTSAPPARLQIVCDSAAQLSPVQIIDTAHNPASIDASLAALERHFPSRQRVIVFASSRDKDYAAMLELLLPRCESLILTSYCNNPRSLPTDELLAAAHEIRASLLARENIEHIATLRAAASPAEAVDAGRKCCDDTGVLLITGSFFLAAEVLPLYTS